jgi:hypothetical protein
MYHTSVNRAGTKERAVVAHQEWAKKNRTGRLLGSRPGATQECDGAMADSARRTAQVLPPAYSSLLPWRPPLESVEPLRDPPLPPDSLPP